MSFRAVQYDLDYYNGFSPAERRAVTPVQNVLFRTSQLVRPTICSICGFSDPAHLDGAAYIFSHLERYDRPTEIYPACKRRHAALHRRFVDPERWERVLKRQGQSGMWFNALSLDPASRRQPFAQTYPRGLPLPNSRPPDKPKQGVLRLG